MGMCRHRVPHVTLVKLRNAHHQLTALNAALSLMDVAIDGPFIRTFNAAQMIRLSLFLGSLLRRISVMCRCGYKVELSRLLIAITFK
ncbi:hypothetical protein D3C76_1636680 [compost metagenome]